MKKKASVYVKFPRTGLGNMLLVWSRGYVFATINDIPLITSSWGAIRWGAWIRWERKKRMYWGYFKENTWWERISLSLRKKSYNIISEPRVSQLSLSENERSLFIFDRIYTDNDLFSPVRSHRLLVRQGIMDMLLPDMQKRLNEYETPVISVHIRRGDFKLGNPITPNSFFINAINLAREMSGKELPVTVFTDAAMEEISDVLSLPGVKPAENKPDILDILLMSRSKLIVLSQSSTFSYWGAFLSDAIVIKPEGDWQNDLRPAEINHTIFEGNVNFSVGESVEQLKKSLKAYKW
jgi:glycosyl transferase family 11